MSNPNMKNIAAVILAAGKGKRMEMKSANKVTAHLAKRPLIVHIVEFMEALGLNTILTVVGYHKESVQESLKNHTISFVTKADQGINQLMVIPLMKSNCRFIQNIQNTCQASANLRGQANPLSFSTSQG